MEINSVSKIEELRKTVKENLKRSFEMLKKLYSQGGALVSFESLKFDKSVVDPIKGIPLNFIEMLNQSFSDLVMLEAVEQLLKLYPGHTFHVMFGARSGPDIISEDKMIVCECFAVVSARSNDKLKKDSDKLMLKYPDSRKYIIFYLREDTEERIQKITEKYPDIEYIRIFKFNI